MFLIKEIEIGSVQLTLFICCVDVVETQLSLERSFSNMFKSVLNAAKDVSSSAIEQSKKAVDSTKQKLADFDEKNTCSSCGKVLSTTLAM